VFDPVANEVKWGPFLDGNERVLSYSVTPPKTASGIVIFTGLASFDGTDVPITGKRQAALEPGTSTATLTSLQRSVEGSAQLTFAGEAGRTYRIEATTDLVNWTSLGTVTGTGDTWQFTDTSAANLGLRFYRAVPVP
jgi:hypothetical protein